MADERTWFVLHHVPGPAVPDGESVFDQPAMGEHVAFLQRRIAAGELVAAGPLPNNPNEGMTVLDVDTLEDAERLATQDDAAVVAGVLQVTVRPWRVVMVRDQ
jgi:uncharacterized protein YciI